MSTKRLFLYSRKGIMRTKNILAALLLMIAGLQTTWAQGFRVYKSDGTVLQFSLRTDSIVFYEEMGTDVDFGPYSPVNQMIVGTWYEGKHEVCNFYEDGTTDFAPEATYKFLPYQGTIMFYDKNKMPIGIIKVHDMSAQRMIISSVGDNFFRPWNRTPEKQLVTAIILSDYDITLKPNDVKVLTATIIPDDADNQEVTWESSDESIAEVNKTGRVIANAEGQCIITCSAKDGSGQKAECIVTVSTNIPEPVYVTSIILSETAVTIETGKTSQLQATVLPENADNPAVTWESDKTDIATVDETGLVTAVAEGQCTITCSAMDGSGVTATCQVTVTASGSGGSHEYVDLGLPSGTLWATCNIGANSPEEYGNYYAWGETETKEEYEYDNYKFYKLYKLYDDEFNYELLKYCTNEIYGTVDNKTELDPEDDAATVNWGSEWEMPSREQLEELINSSYATVEWTTRNDINGLLITSKSNGNSIFLPAAASSFGYWQLNQYGDYWSRDLDSESDDMSYILEFATSENLPVCTVDHTSREAGCSVRPVRKQEIAVQEIRVMPYDLFISIGDTYQLNVTVLPERATNKEVAWSSLNTDVATVDGNGVVTGVSEGGCFIYCEAKDGSGVRGHSWVNVTKHEGMTDGHRWIDLGLPSGTCWEIIAYPSEMAWDTDERALAWGETERKQDYSWNSWNSYKYGTDAFGITKYCTDEIFGHVDGKTELDAEDDYYTVKYGSNWQLPSEADFQELLDNTTVEWSHEGFNGCIFTSKINGETLFLPASGYFEGTEIVGAQQEGYYWTCTLSEYCNMARALYFTENDGARLVDFSRHHGCDRIGVTKKK